MSRQYSLKKFLRVTPNKLIKEYFDRKNITLGINFDKMKETKVEPLCAAIADIDDEVLRKSIDSDFQDIYRMGFEGGIKRILQTASFQDVELHAAFEDLKGFDDKAFYTFLYHPEIFEFASKFACTEYLPSTRWRKVKNIHPFVKPDYEFKANALAEAISEYFYKAEGRGKSCFADYYNQGSEHFYFCYPEDYSRSEIVWENGNHAKRYSSPSFEVIFVYDEDSETLDSFYSGDAKTDKKLKELFVQSVLGMDKLPDKANEAVYDLNALKNPDFQFSIEEGSIVKKIEVKGLRFATQERTITINNNKEKESLQALLDDIVRSVPSVNLLSDSINQVTMVATLVANNRKGETTKTFNITYPGTCSLKYGDKDSILRQVIINSGLQKATNLKKEVKVA